MDHYANDAFGDDRSFFGSNVPVDGSVGTYGELYAVYDRVTAGRSPEARERLFATNAERFHRLEDPIPTGSDTGRCSTTY